MYFFADIGRGRAAKRLAAEHDLTVETGPEKPVGNFRLYNAAGARSKKVRRRIQRAGGTASVFDYQYEVDHHDGEESQVSTERFTCALVDLPFSAPSTDIEREGMTTKFLKMAGGSSGVEIGVPEFDKRHKVRTTDESFVRALLDDQIVGWILAADSVGSSMTFELRGPHLLCISKRRPISSYPRLLDWAEDFVRLTPASLVESHPRH